MRARIKSFSEYVGERSISESLMYHINNDISITESVYRPGSTGHIKLLSEARSLFESGVLKLSQVDSGLFEGTELGLTGIYNGHEVPLDLPLEVHHMNEAEYKGRQVELNVPKRGGSKKFYVYVRNPKTKKINKIEFGDTSGLTAKVRDPKARKSFAARHRCAEKKDKTKAGYWACRVNRYAHLWGGKTYPGYW